MTDVKEAMSRTHVMIGASEFTLSSLLQASVAIVLLHKSMDVVNLLQFMLYRMGPLNGAYH